MNKPPEPKQMYFSDFLETAPVGQRVSIYIKDRPPGNLEPGMNVMTFPTPGSRRLHLPPTLRFHCSRKRCTLINQQPSTFDAVKVDHMVYGEQANAVAVDYNCAICKDSLHLISLRVWTGAWNPGISSFDAIKVGEWPRLGPPLAEELVDLIAKEELEFLTKGYACERDGHGLGALSYYRRVTENMTKKLFTEIRKVAVLEHSPPAALAKLDDAISKTQYNRAMEAGADAIPPKLFLRGQNPMKELYNKISSHVHGLSDADCLAIAAESRKLLSWLAARIELELADERSMVASVSALNKASASPKK